MPTVRKNILLKVVYAALKDFLILLKRNVFVEIFALSLAVTHLAEHSAVGRGDTLDSAYGAVEVELNAVGGLAAEINVLGSDLTVCRKLLNGFEVSHKPALAVRNGNCEYVACVNAAEPR